MFVDREISVWTKCLPFSMDVGMSIIQWRMGNNLYLRNRMLIIIMFICKLGSEMRYTIIYEYSGVLLGLNIPCLDFVLFSTKFVVVLPIF